MINTTHIPGLTIYKSNISARCNHQSSTIEIINRIITTTTTMNSTSTLIVIPDNINIHDCSFSLFFISKTNENMSTFIILSGSSISHSIATEFTSGSRVNPIPYWSCIINRSTKISTVISESTIVNISYITAIININSTITTSLIISESTTAYIKTLTTIK